MSSRPAENLQIRRLQTAKTIPKGVPGAHPSLDPSLQDGQKEEEEDVASQLSREGRSF